MAASGRGSIWHLRTELLKQLGEFPVRFIPYDGSGPSQVAALSGEVDLVHTALSEQIALIRGGRLRALVAVQPAPLTLRDYADSGNHGYDPSGRDAAPLAAVARFPTSEGHAAGSLGENRPGVSSRAAIGTRAGLSREELQRALWP